uniref:Uncharacterized protein n=1 Tax=Arundo donax TaxID=35708 RepID=A0A0A8ZUY2_ARUDO
MYYIFHQGIHMQFAQNYLPRPSIISKETCDIISHSNFQKCWSANVSKGWSPKL